ncbi:hypothetical protein DFH08DRAFT_990686 [Mycena albidolilacea]|uniref:Uncharacterized protein n=1 Tax=Mycena albidolilacea TaxID=1033008 RepID=A0AAD7EU85_9AGAR|nr:hypothetical protein DFH08DRAFT_990686 [Mycena albidolilacea]
MCIYSGSVSATSADSAPPPSPSPFPDPPNSDFLPLMSQTSPPLEYIPHTVPGTGNPLPLPLLFLLRIGISMNSLLKLLPPRLRLLGWRSAKPKRPVKQKQLQLTILDGVLDISKEARDAIALAEDEIEIAIAFPLEHESPTSSHSHFDSGGGSYSPTYKHKSLQTPTAPASPVSSLLPPSLSSSPSSSSAKSLLAPPPVGGCLDPDLPAIPASTLGTHRGFKGRRIDTLRIPIPPMPTGPPPSPPSAPRASASPESENVGTAPEDANASARNTVSAFPIARCRTFPVSPPPPAHRARVRSLRGSVGVDWGAAQGEDTHEAEEEEGILGYENEHGARGSGSTTPPGIPPAPVLVFLRSPCATFTKRASVSALLRNSAAREAFPFPIDETEPLSVVKRVSAGTSAPSEFGVVPASPRTNRISSLEPAMDELFSDLDDVYAEYHDSGSLVSISLSSEYSDYDSARDETGHSCPTHSNWDDGADVEWRTRYSLADECDDAATFSFVPLQGAEESETETRPCPYSFLLERRQTLSMYLAEGSRSQPDFALRRSRSRDLA